MALKIALVMGVVITKVIGLDGVENRDKSKISGCWCYVCISNNLDFDYVFSYSLMNLQVLGRNVNCLGLRVVAAG